MSRIGWIRPWLAAGSLAASLTVSAPTWAVEASDPWLTTKVKLSLLTAADVDGLDINVDTNDGRVTLHGKAATAAEKAKAETLARKVEGVRDVRNLIQVVPSEVEKQVSASDSDIEIRVEKALGSEPALAGSSIEVKSVNKGAVLLAGQAETLSTHVRAIEVARAVPGVRRVESEVTSPDRLADAEIWRDADATAPSGPPTTASDMWITTATKVRLIAADVPALDVNVDTRSGVVTLFGIVGTAAEKANAEAEARKVDGVKSVLNEIQVVLESRQAGVERKDAVIQKNVEQRLGSREDLSDSDIDVEVSNGVVRLTGTVTSQGDRLAALTSARASEGVRSVVGDLRVERN